MDKTTIIVYYCISSAVVNKRDLVDKGGDVKKIKNGEIDLN